MAGRGSAPAAEPETDVSIEKVKAQPVPLRPQRSLPRTLRVKVRKGQTMLLGNGPLDTKLRYGAGFAPMREDDPVEMPLYRIYKKDPDPKTGLCLAGRNLVLADGSEIEPIYPDEAAEIHAAWNAEVGKREAPTDVREQGKIFSGPKPERMVAS